MNVSLLDALITVTEAARQMPETPALKRALKRVDQKIERLQVKDRRLRGILEQAEEREEALKTERVAVLSQALEAPMTPLRPGQTRQWVERYMEVRP